MQVTLQNLLRREIQEAAVEGEKTVASDKPVAEEEAADGKKENAATERVEEPENKVDYLFLNFFFCVG